MRARVGTGRAAMGKQYANETQLWQGGGLTKADRLDDTVRGKMGAANIWNAERTVKWRPRCWGVAL